MKEAKTIDIEAVPADPKDPGPATSSQTQALAMRPQAGAVDRAMTIDELKANLAFIHDVMANVMKEGQDYGKIPGTGDKPSLLQPGAQKLCMTFQLTDSVKEEKCTDLPNYHREYSFVVTVTSATGRAWDGVGTCSTLESKYRYRKAERRCPACGKNKIIQGKAEYGGGWICYKKKNGCGAKFAENDTRITSQAADTVEYENPPDYWNTVRKMAFKRALVHAAINATNTSELWTQDVEEMAQNAEAAPKAPAASRPPQQTAQPAKAPAQGQPATKRPAPATKPTSGATKPTFFATEEQRTKMIEKLTTTGKETYDRRLITDYFEKLGQLFPGEGLEGIPLRFVPATQKQWEALENCIGNFEAGGDAVRAFDPNPEPEPKPAGKKPAAAAPKPAPKPTPAPAAKQNPDWFWDIIISVPRKGQKRDEYLKHPDTIRSLYDLRHGSDDESAAARSRLFGLVQNWDAAPRTVGDRTYEPSEADHRCREALDAFAEWFEKNHGSARYEEAP